jgi:hypothetical protein
MLCLQLRDLCLLLSQRLGLDLFNQIWVLTDLADLLHNKIFNVLGQERRRITGRGACFWRVLHA